MKKVKDAKVVNESKKNRKIEVLIWIALVIVLLGIGFSIYYFGFRENDNEKIVLTEDEKKFKQEHEELNGKVREKTGVINPTMEVMEDNNVVYLSDEETVKFLKNGTGLLYMGFRECPWCRNAIPVLLTAASNANIEKVFYLDVTNIKSTIVLNAKNKPQVSKKGTDAYYEILDLLKEYLGDYNLTDKKGNKISTGEKRIFSPSVLTIKDGVVTGFHVGTVDGHDKDSEGVLPDLTKEQKEELNKIYADMINTISDSSCNDGCE